MKQRRRDLHCQFGVGKNEVGKELHRAQSPHFTRPLVSVLPQSCILDIYHNAALIIAEPSMQSRQATPPSTEP